MPFLPAAEPIILNGRAMGTTWSVKFLQPVPPLNPPTLHARIAEKLEQLEQQFSTYRPTSEVSRFNARPSTEWIAASPELVRVAADSRRLSARTSGVFDPTIEPLVRLWGFGAQRRTGNLPASAEIAAARARVDWRRLEVRVSPPAVRKTSPDLAVDFSSMAKGFAADAVSELLVSLGASHHFARVAGDIKTAGSHVWRTGIEQPSATANAPALAQVVNLAGHALSTSGDANNFFELQGRRYGHIIDPRTGAPVSGALASVSVIHASCAQSSALATALFVLGAEDGYNFAVRERLACLFIIRDGAAFKQRATPQFLKLTATTP
ncbi:MAG: FAD:protein FMN transferase [Undibacterium sp.]|nr:FAD:protein FMN transferase [Opitutaceae bacterium]